MGINCKRVSAKCLFSMLLFWMCWGGRLEAQHALDETGVSFGGGALMLFNSRIEAKAGYNAHFYFSHYACGKRWGFHFEGGYRGSHGVMNGFYLPTEDPINGPPSLTLHNLEIGAYYKLRPHTYHRAKESGMLFGPKLGIVPFYQVGYGLKDTFQNRGKVNPVVPAIHICGWFRRPLSKEMSLFLRPGAEYYPASIFRVNDLRYSGFYLFMNLGITFWNSH